ncbi:GspH/FimT family pseudopilin [Arhodomonas aquaeolei]|uniref:GspH/FimT family pseudopilin n=1 Tax=Arhodomonas aquaeolei TaxID=2369 RepID=UPI0003665BA6|nr:GspH/FimT family pseudopilin [Arhodomonas aquaeolei]
MNSKIRGFTLIELMLTVIVAAILLSVAIPSFRTFIQNNQLTTATNQFVTALNLTRSEAVKRGRSVRISALSPSGSNEWGGGFMVWIDENGDGTYDASDDQQLRRWDALDGNMTVDSNNGRTLFIYDGDGVVNAGDTVDVCDSGRSGETGRRLAIDVTGRISISDDSYSGCS